MRLEDKVCLVTGAGSGIGAAVARTFAQAGGRVILADVNEAAVQRVADDIPGGRAIALDVSDSGQADAAVHEVVEREGRLDVLIHFAGIDDPAVKQRFADFLQTGVREPVGTEISDAQWSRMMRVNLDGSFYMIRAALRAMIPNRAGSIVAMSSVGGIEGVMGYGHYCAAKAGVIALVKSFAKEVAEWGIRVNAVAPDPVRTPMSAPTPASLIPKLPIGRYAEPEEIARATLFLASDDASYVSGETLILSPGRLTI